MTVIGLHPGRELADGFLAPVSPNIGLQPRGIPPCTERKLFNIIVYVKDEGLGPQPIWRRRGFHSLQ
jgi:hypothetical protein